MNSRLYLHRWSIGIDLKDMVAGNQGFRYALTVVIIKVDSPGFSFLKQYKHVLDNGGEFTSRELQQFCSKHHITVYLTSPPYYPLRQRHHGSDAPNLQGGPLRSLPGSPPPIAPTPSALSDHHELGSTHLNKSTALLRILLSPCTHVTERYSSVYRR